MTDPLFADIDAICFDLDGTLADTDDAAVERMSRRLQPLERLRQTASAPILARRLVMAAETPLNFVLSFLDWLSLDEVLAPVLKAMHAARGYRSVREIEIIPGVYPMLEALSARYPLALVTARDQHGTEIIVDRLGLKRFFPHIAHAHTCRRTKPHPAPLLWAADKLSVPPERCLMVGDTTVDIRSGRAAGFKTVGVLCGFGERRELNRVGAHRILDQTAELSSLL